MLRKRELKDVMNELALYKQLASYQEKLLVAYRTGRLPSNAALDGIVRVRKALEKFRALDLLRGD